ncbi:hypothetical protein C0J52_07701 [Blattella germanica]|nr:hypothetical protein C0J52_07701 [Blattella germanica]
MSTRSIYYGCEIYPCSSLRTRGGQRAIKKWISLNGKMNTTEMILEGSQSTGPIVLALCSALYFQADWGSPFYCQKIGKLAFFKNPMEILRVQTLYYEGICKAGSSTSLEAKWVHLSLEQQVCVSATERVFHHNDYPAYKDAQFGRSDLEIEQNCSHTNYKGG